MVIDKLGSILHGSSRERFQGAILETGHNDETLLLLKPLTFMNNSGQSVAEVARWYKVPSQRILLVYDELDLPFGTVRLKPKGSPGGHNGCASVLEHLGTDEVPRLRIGIGRPTKGSTVNYVLSRFFEDERKVLPAVIDVSAEAAMCWLNDGIDVAMNRYNRTSIETHDPVAQDFKR